MLRCSLKKLGKKKKSSFLCREGNTQGGGMSGREGLRRDKMKYEHLE